VDDPGDAPIGAVIDRFERLLDSLDAGDARRFFLATYLRTTVAIDDAVRAGSFGDPTWVGAWDDAFAGLYLDAIEADQRGDAPSAPWQVAFGAARDQSDLPPLRHVLLGINAHINFDLPQALLAVMGPDDFDDPATVSRRGRDHEAVDSVLAGRVGAEDAELVAASGPPRRIDRALRPLNEWGTKRFLREARVKVWANAIELDRARRQGDAALARRLDELAERSVAKLERLVAPGQVLLKLAISGFGVSLDVH
jgi:hypothetical protein